MYRDVEANSTATILHLFGFIRHLSGQSPLPQLRGAMMFTSDDSDQPNRLTIYRLDVKESRDTFAQDVLAGLTANPKKLLPRYFYDELGSRLFEAICCLPEYHVTRDEEEILSERIDEITKEIKGFDSDIVRLIELGSGSAQKTRHVIEALFRRNANLHYLPIDISRSSLERSSKELLQAYPSLRITAYAADYSSALRAVQSSDSKGSQHNLRTVVLFLGSSIGNLDSDESRNLLRDVRAALHPGDVFLIGADLKKSPDILIPAYADSLGVTAAFNLNLLVRINRELGGNFNLNKFEHRALYNEERSRVEMHLFSREAQTVEVREIDLEVNFETGESIHTENSYKYSIEDLRELAAATGFRLDRSWFDSSRRFSLSMFSAI
jgi:dimethylhistidine N-methyltransferase